MVKMTPLDEGRIRQGLTKVRKIVGKNACFYRSIGCYNNDPVIIVSRDLSNARKNVIFQYQNPDITKKHIVSVLNFYKGLAYEIEPFGKVKLLTNNNYSYIKRNI